MSKKMTAILSAGTAGFAGYLIFLWGMETFENPMVAIPIAMASAGIIGYSMTKFAANLD